MKSILNIIGSMKSMAVLMLIFALSIATATFIENDFGTPSAKAVVYNATWFELLLVLLAINLMINMVRYKMFQTSKAMVFTFHLSFIIILIGAAVTRYAGYEGVFHIRQGDTSNQLLSSENYVQLTQLDGEKTFKYDAPLLLSTFTTNHFSKEIAMNGFSVHVELIDYIADAVKTLKNDPNGEAYAIFMLTTPNGAKEVQLKAGDVINLGDVVLDFNATTLPDNKAHISLYIHDGELYMRHSDAIDTMRMDDQVRGTIAPAEATPLANRTLYSIKGANLVLRDFKPHAKVVYTSSKKRRGPMQKGENILRFKVSSEQSSTVVEVKSQEGVLAQTVPFMLDNHAMQLGYGAKYITLPFSLELKAFELERYPGSNSPASYASEVVVHDNEHQFDYRIFMNHVLEYQGYRFFQSSYDQDEQGTVLSVNHDPGTPITYFGYLILAIGLFGSFFMRNGRFATLQKIAKASSKQTQNALLLALFMSMSLSIQPLKAESIIEVAKSIDKNHANMFGTLIVQDANGRMKPVDTLNSEVLHKMARTDSLLGLNANQVVVGMMVRPDVWRDIKLIKTSHKKINEILNIDANDKSAAFTQFFDYPDEMQGYKLYQYVNDAIRKAPGKRDKFDKAVLKVDERVNVAYMVFSGALFRLYPIANDTNNKWVDTITALKEFKPQYGQEVKNAALQYFSTVDSAIKSGDWTQANEAITRIDDYQNKYGKAVIPSQKKRDLEITYNHLNIFEHLWPLYFIIGFVLLFASFTTIIKPKLNIRWLTRITWGLLVLFFVLHTVGLAIRWYISGHAPWSNGYESMIYIAWASVLAGFIFSRHSTITLASTGILAGLILFVAHLNWMDPQVTNLVPVLQSYWLSIHVSMITASYGFLALGALLGFISLILFMLLREDNAKQISSSIKELNAINEMSLMIGLALLTVGNFLGGVWANESWGRYWGWDPKETWALVTILVYAVVVHLRFIKALYSPFSYSVISLLAFTSVLMTYFGVNYYLAGMHSYAKGDSVPIPEFVPISYGIIFIVIILAMMKKRYFQRH